MTMQKNKRKQLKKTKGYVYYFCIPSFFSYGELKPIERQKEIDSISNEEVKKEKYFVWKLLEYALYQNYNISIEECNLKKDPNGKWISNLCNVSLSHRKGFVAVAISDDLIGVDVEYIHVPVVDFENKILTEEEKNIYKTLTKEEKKLFLILKWSEKESIYKMDNSKGINFKKIETLKHHTKHIFINNQTHVLTVTTNKEVDIDFILVTNL